MANSLIVSNPSVDGPAFRFGSGIDGVAAYYSYLPDVGAPQSAWHIAQWHTSETLDPAKMQVGDSTRRDSIFGIPDYSWDTVSGNLGLSVYGEKGNFGYRLSSYNGMLLADGSQNIFLEAPVQNTGSTLDHPITFDADEAITGANSKGLAQQILNGFTATFNAAGSKNYNSGLHSQSVFLQVELADSRGYIPSYQNLSDGTSIFNVSGQDSLKFTATNQLSHVHIDLNAALLSFINNYGVAFGTNEPDGFASLSNWTVTSTYLGLETTNGGGASLDVSNAKLQWDGGSTYTKTSDKIVTITSDASTLQTSAQGGASVVEAHSPAPVTHVGAVAMDTSSPNYILDTSPDLAFMDGTSNVGGITKFDTPAAGGPEYIKWTYIMTGSDNMAFSTATPNVFIHSGGGMDAIAVQSGNNILDGGTGSSYLTGGSGNDIFFVDARPADLTWSTLINFHKGDEATIWGFKSGVSSMKWDYFNAGDSTGHSGSGSGATLEICVDGGNGRNGTGVDAKVTFVGLSIEKASSMLQSTGSIGSDGNYLHIYNQGV